MHAVVPVRFGGLGNQLFQVAAAIVYGRECNKVPKVSSSANNPHATTEYLTSVFQDLESVPDISAFHEFSHASCFEPWACLPMEGDVSMKGYFQYYPPIARHEQYIRELFLSGLRAVDVSEISETAVAIHVRRGDYLRLPDFHYIITAEYYMNAMSQFPDNTQFLVFSDDIAWCKDQPMFHEAERYAFTFVDEPNEIRAFAKMSAAKGGTICGNSTFSWWAAFLGPHANRSPVVVPASRWIAAKVIDLFPEEWIRL